MAQAIRLMEKYCSTLALKQHWIWLIMVENERPIIISCINVWWSRGTDGLDHGIFTILCTLLSNFLKHHKNEKTHILEIFKNLFKTKKILLFIYLWYYTLLLITRDSLQECPPKKEEKAHFWSKFSLLLHQLLLMLCCVCHNKTCVCHRQGAAHAEDWD